MNKTKIEWCDSTWNPVTGCLHGCEYCYARKIANRFGRAFGKEENFIGSTWSTEADGNNHILELPIKDERKEKIAPYPFEFVPTFHRYRLDIPQKWKKPRTIFVCSMADLFGDWVPDEWIEAVFEACRKAPQHRYLFLTNNPKRYKELADKEQLPRSDNMWYGSTVTAMENYFISKKSFNTFLSIEPMFAPISPLTINGVKWLIIGAETGNRKNKVVPEKTWIGNICTSANVPIFMKDSLIPIVGEKNMRREYPF